MQAKDTNGCRYHQSLGEGPGTDSPPGPPENASPGRHLDLGILASRAVTD